MQSNLKKCNIVTILVYLIIVSIHHKLFLSSLRTSTEIVNLHVRSSFLDLFYFILNFNICTSNIVTTFISATHKGLYKECFKFLMFT